MEKNEQTILLLRKRLKEMAARLRQAKYEGQHDILTGLPNRQLIFDRLQQAMLFATRSRRNAAVLMIDLNHFKEINDRLGHAAGDQLLQLVALRLKDCLRASDSAGRLGGDEFAVVLADVAGVEAAASVAEKISLWLAEPYVLDHEVVTVTASVGLAIYGGERLSADELLEAADKNMYCAKRIARIFLIAPHAEDGD